jgi:hypothetical protein
MRSRESPLEAWCVAWARFRGVVVVKMTGCDGIPDRIFFVPGGSPVIGEFKAKGKKGGGLQKATQPWYLDKLRADGYEAYCWDTKEAFLAVMKERLERCTRVKDVANETQKTAGVGTTRSQKSAPFKMKKSRT